MGILEDGIARINAKRSQRIESESQQRSPYQIATYQGKSLVDGSDIIQIGANEPVSGFRLVSNTPLTIGEQVSLRSNSTGGLGRVDARNRSTEIVEVITTENIYFYASLSFIRILLLGTPIYSQFASNPVDSKQKWSVNTDGTPNRFVRWIQGIASWTISDLGTPVNPANVVYTYTLDANYIYLGININASTNISAYFFNVTISYDTTFDLSGLVSEYPYRFGVPNPSSIIEAEFIPSVGTLNQIQLIKSGNDLLFECAVNASGESISAISGNFRYRLRGSTTWFSIVI